MLRLCIAVALLACSIGLFACTPTSETCSSANDCRSDEVCVESQCRRVCNAETDCTGSEDCTDGVCLPARPRSDASVVDSAAPDTASPTDSASPSDTAVSLPDSAETYVDAAVASPDAAAPPDAGGAVTDSAIPYSCPNGIVDDGEACDGQPGCGENCQALPGWDCAPDAQDQVVCYRDFPPGFPSHIDLASINPADLEEPVITCTDALIHTDDSMPVTDFCGVMVPTVNQGQTAGPALQIYLFKSLDLQGQLRFVGSRVPVIVAYGDISTTAAIDVGAGPLVSGPGAATDCGASAGELGTDQTGAGAGGGGGGNFESGGRGGTVSTSSGGWGDENNAGQELPDQGSLQGGCPGGAGGVDRSGEGTPASGGGAGGALQISAAGRLLMQGAIIADGAGGVGGERPSSGGGGGGGSGGTVHLEASALDVLNNLVIVTGGGGGQGGAPSGAGEDGAAGRHGGAGGTANSGAGGSGGGGGDDLEPGLDGENGWRVEDKGGGGGGGSSGKLFLLTL